MEWLEANPLPTECKNCQDEDCGECEHAGKRWYLLPKDELKLRRKKLIKNIERLQQDLYAINIELLPFSEQQKAALTRRTKMTYSLFEECLKVCSNEDAMDMYFAIWSAYPDQFDELERIAKKEFPADAAHAPWNRV